MKNMEDLKHKSSAEKTADEMFAELGYELEDEKICPHSYRYKKNINRFDIKEIVLEKANKLITICYYKLDVDEYMEALNLIEYHLNKAELQAINRKCRELGWLDE